MAKSSAEISQVTQPVPNLTLQHELLSSYSASLPSEDFLRLLLGRFEAADGATAKLVQLRCIDVIRDWAENHGARWQPSHPVLMEALKTFHLRCSSEGKVDAKVLKVMSDVREQIRVSVSEVAAEGLPDEVKEFLTRGPTKDRDHIKSRPDLAAVKRVQTTGTSTTPAPAPPIAKEVPPPENQKEQEEAALKFLNEADIDIDDFINDIASTGLPPVPGLPPAASAPSPTSTTTFAPASAKRGLEPGSRGAAPKQTGFGSRATLARSNTNEKSSDSSVTSPAATSSSPATLTPSLPPSVRATQNKPLSRGRTSSVADLLLFISGEDVPEKKVASKEEKEKESTKVELPQSSSAPVPSSTTTGSYVPSGFGQEEDEEEEAGGSYGFFDFLREEPDDAQFLALQTKKKKMLSDLAEQLGVTSGDKRIDPAVLKALSEEEPEKLSKLPKKQKTAFADFIRKAMPKKLDTPQSRMRAESAQELLKFLEDPKESEYAQSVADFVALVRNEGGAQPGPISESSTVKIRDNLMKLVDAALPAEVLLDAIRSLASKSTRQYLVTYFKNKLKHLPKNRVERKRAKAMILLLGHLEEASAANPQMDRLRGAPQRKQSLVDVLTFITQSEQQKVREEPAVSAEEAAVKQSRQQKSRELAALIEVSGVASLSGADWMLDFLDSDPQPELLQKLLPAQRKAFKKFIKTQYPPVLDRFKEREKALTIIQLTEILEDA